MTSLDCPSVVSEGMLGKPGCFLQHLNFFLFNYEPKGIYLGNVMGVLGYTWGLYTYCCVCWLGACLYNNWDSHCCACSLGACFIQQFRWSLLCLLVRCFFIWQLRWSWLCFVGWMLVYMTIEMIMVVLCWLDACLYDNRDGHGCASLVGCLFIWQLRWDHGTSVVNEGWWQLRWDHGTSVMNDELSFRV
jgi:hypothetical protein